VLLSAGRTCKVRCIMSLLPCACGTPTTMYGACMEQTGRLESRISRPGQSRSYIRIHVYMYRHNVHPLMARRSIHSISAQVSGPHYPPNHRATGPLPPAPQHLSPLMSHVERCPTHRANYCQTRRCRRKSAMCVPCCRPAGESGRLQ
jgi:hypothetical protein